MRRYWKNSRNWRKNFIKTKNAYWINLNIFSIIMIIVFVTILFLTKNNYFLIPLIIFSFLQLFLFFRLIFIAIIVFASVITINIFSNNHPVVFIQGNYKVMKKHGDSIIVKENGQKILLTRKNEVENIDIGNIINIPEKTKIEKIDFSKPFNKYWLSKNIKYKTSISPKILIIDKKTSIFEKMKKYFIRGPNFYKKYVPLLLLGIKTKETAEIYQKTKELGIVHLVIISGFHINLLFFFLSYLLGKIIKKRKKEMGFLILFILFVYLTILGFPISTLRAFLFSFGIFINKFFLKKKLNNLSILSFVLFTIFLINIYSIFDYGFIFSFLLSYCIVFCLDLKYKKIIIPIMMFIISSLLIIYINEQFNFLSWFYTLILTPIISTSYLISFLLSPFKQFLNIYFVGIDSILDFFINFKTNISIFIDPILLNLLLIILFASLFFVDFSVKVRKISFNLQKCGINNIAM